MLTDKTNSYLTMSIDNYKRLVNNHIEKNVSEILVKKACEIYEESEEFFDDKEFLISHKERIEMQDELKNKSMPTPKLLIKEHKEKIGNGQFLTRLAVLAINFTSIFSKIRCLAIKMNFFTIT